MAEVTQAYKDLVFIWHPDRVPKDNTRLVQLAESKLKEINYARDTLREHQNKPKAAAQTEPQTEPQTEQRQRYHPYAAYQASQKQRQPPPAEEPRRAKAESSTNPRDYRAYATTPPPQAPKDPGPADYYAQSRYRPEYHRPEPEPVRSNPNEPQGYREAERSGSNANPASPPRSEQNYSQRNYQQAATPSRPAQADFSGSDFSNRDLKEKDLSNRNFSRSNFSNADLSDAFLHRITLAESNLQNANLFRANMLEADLSKADLRGANLIGADLSGADLRGANLEGAKVGSDDRVMVKMTGARLMGATMPNGQVYEG
jgi:curved DNA-binding protein CbpA